MGAAVYGDQGCTCPPRTQVEKQRDLEERVRRLEEQVAVMFASTPSEKENNRV
jgi:hypothetical protein